MPRPALLRHDRNLATSSRSLSALRHALICLRCLLLCYWGLCRGALSAPGTPGVHQHHPLSATCQQALEGSLVYSASGCCHPRSRAHRQVFEFARTVQQVAGCRMKRLTHKPDSRCTGCMQHAWGGPQLAHSVPFPEVRHILAVCKFEIANETPASSIFRALKCCSRGPRSFRRCLLAPAAQNEAGSRGAGSASPVSWLSAPQQGRIGIPRLSRRVTAGAHGVCEGAS
jgi:hypothetical protein